MKKQPLFLSSTFNGIDQIPARFIVKVDSRKSPNNNDHWVRLSVFTIKNRPKTKIWKKCQHFLCPYEGGCVGQAPTPADLSHSIIFIADAQDPTNNDHWVRPLRQHHIILYDVNNIIIWYNCLNYIVSLYYINAVLGSQVWSWSRAKQRSPLARDPSTACFPQRAIKSDIRQHIGLP